MGDSEHAHAHVDKHGQLVSDGDGHRVFSNEYYAAREEAEAKVRNTHGWLLLHLLSHVEL